MAEQIYFSVFTEQGLALLTEAIQNGTKLGITHMAFGDGGGSLPTPEADVESLVNEVHRTSLNSLAPDPKNANWLRAEAIIASAIGGFNIRELGLYAGDVLVAYSNYPATYKPNPADGTARIMTFRMVLQIDNVANFELVIDPDIVLATIQFVNENLVESKVKLDNGRTQADKNKDVINALDFGIIDSETEDQLQKLNQLFSYAAANNAQVVFPSDYKIYADLTNTQLIFNESVSANFNNTTLLLYTSRNNISTSLEFMGKQFIVGLNIHLLTGTLFSRFATIRSDTYIWKFKVTTEDSELLVNAKTKYDSTFLPSGNNITVRDYEISGVSRHFNCYSLTVGGMNNIKFLHGLHKNYIQGIGLYGDNVTVDDVRFIDVSSTAATAHLEYNAGQNAIVGASNILSISNVFIDGSCEHGIYLSTVLGESLNNVFITNLTVKNTQQSSLKVRGATNLNLNNISFQNAANWTTPNVNEDGLHLENCRHVQSFGLTIGRSDADKNTAYAGVFLSAVQDASFKKTTINAAWFSSVYFANTTDDYEQASNKNIVFDGITVDRYGTNFVYTATESSLDNVVFTDATLLNTQNRLPISINSTNDVGNVIFNLKLNDHVGALISGGTEKHFVSTCRLSAQATSKSSVYNVAGVQTNNFNPGTNKTNGLCVQLSGSYTAAAGAYGAALDFITGTRRKAAIATWQISDNINQQGLAFFTTNFGATSDAVFVSAKLSESTLTAGVDNFSSLGTATIRWKEIFAGNGTIQTSDERYKQDIETLDDIEKRVALQCKSLIKKFRFKEAVVEKGADARLHIGVIAQEVKAAFEAENLDAFQYGILCYDTWDAKEAVIETIDAKDEVWETAVNGEQVLVQAAVQAQEIIISPAVLAGNRYSVRYDELAMFILSAI